MRGIGVAAVVLTLAAAAAAAQPRGTILTTVDSVYRFGADGNRIAYGRETAALCDAATAVDARSGRKRLLPSAASRCLDLWPSLDIEEIAVAGDRVAWTANHSSNSTARQTLTTARVGSPRARRVADGTGYSGTGEEFIRTRRIGHLAGDGGTMAYATWVEPEGKRAVRDERLWRIGPTGAPLALGRVPGIRMLAVEHGRVAVLRRGGIVTLIDVRAGARRTITLQGAGNRTPAGFALSGALLVVLWNQTLEVYDAANGFRVREWGIRELTLDGGFVDVEGDWITHVARNNVYVHRISDGAEGRVPSERFQPARCDKNVNGQVEKIGLVYAARGYDEPGCDKSTLGLIPFDELGRYVSPGSG